MTNHVYVRDFVLQPAGSTGTGNGNEWDLQGLNVEASIYMTWASGSSAGQVVIEASNVTAYAGTWAPLTTISWSAASKIDLYQFQGTFRYVRARIASAITNGSVTVLGDAN